MAENNGIERVRDVKTGGRDKWRDERVGRALYRILRPAISREIARLPGGEIRLTSTLGEGSTFTIYLPVHIPPKNANPTYEARPNVWEPTAGPSLSAICYLPFRSELLANLDKKNETD